MRFKVRLPDEQVLQIEKSFWMGKLKLRLGKTLIGTTKSYFSKEPIKLTLKDGSQHELLVKNHWLDPAPLVFLDGQELNTEFKLKKWETAIIAIPALLVVFAGGGAVPALIAISSVYLNFFIAREKSIAAPIRWTLIGIVSLCGFAIIVLFAVWLNQIGDNTSAARQADSKNKTIWVIGPDGRPQQIAAPQAARTYPQTNDAKLEPSFDSRNKPATQVEREVLGQ